MKRILAALSVSALVLGPGARPALAQRANGPYASAFGPLPDVDRTQGLDLAASFFGVADHNVVPVSDDSVKVDQRLNESGASGGLTGSLNYGRYGDRVRFTLGGEGTVRQYQSVRDDVAGAYHASTSLNAKLASKLTLEAIGNAGYSPFSDFAPFIDFGSMANAALFTPAFGFTSAAPERTVIADTSIGLTSNVTKRTSLSASAVGRDWRVLDAPQNDVRSWGGRAGISHRVSRGLGLHLSYGRDQNEYAVDQQGPYVNETIDAGLDYGDTLTFDRRTSLTFATSTGAVRYYGDTHYRVNGMARLSRGIGRTWSTWLGYRRDTEYRSGFREPLLTDSFNTGIGGQMSWRVRWQALGAYSRGTVGFGSEGFTNYLGTSRLSVALTKTLAFYGQYAYFHYDIPPGSSTLYLLPRFSRQAIAVGLSVALPIVNDIRPPKPAPQP